MPKNPGPLCDKSCSQLLFLNSSCSGIRLGLVFPVDVVGGLGSAAPCLLTRVPGAQC